MLVQIRLRVSDSESGPETLVKPFFCRCVISIIALISLVIAVYPALADGSEAKRLALLIANSDYKDASSHRVAAQEDAATLAEELNRDGFDVGLMKDLDLDHFRAAVDTFIEHISPGSTALLYFNGIGIQVAHQTFLVPVNVNIQSEADIKKKTVSLDETLAAINRRGASVKIVVIDAAHRNQMELRFRGFSAGLSSIETPEGTLAMFATAPNKVGADTSESSPSLFMSELVKELRAPDISVEEALMHTRIGVSRASNGEEVPWVASSLVEPFYLGEAGSSSPGHDAVPPIQASRTPVETPPAPSNPATPVPQQAPLQRPDIVTQGSVPLPTAPLTSPVPSASSGPSSTTPPARNSEQVAKAPVAPVEPPNMKAVPPAGATADPNSSTSKVVIAAPAPAVVVPKVAAPLSPPASGASSPTFRDCQDCPEMMPLAEGSFLMGDGSTMFDRPVHRVVISKPFAVGVSEVTFADWNKCFLSAGCKFKPDNQGFGEDQHPVINISWFDAKDYIAWLSKTTGKTYRLPSEAEWEYAARGGTRTAYAWGASLGVHLANCADCGGNGDARTTLPIKSFQANAYGLYDMAGNVAEWVEDCWNQSYNGAPKDGAPWLTGDCGQRVLRGGSFDSAATYTKPSARFRYDADVRYWANGFRVVRELP